MECEELTVLRSVTTPATSLPSPLEHGHASRLWLTNEAMADTNDHFSDS